MEGRIMQIQNFSVNDGEGIRTTVFMAGCPLHCPWCANPEGLDINVNKLLIEQKTVSEIVEAVKPQIPFFRHSGGGVTFSGGEATVQLEFLKELVAELYDLGVDLCIETCGYFDFNKVKEVLHKMSLVFVDIKHMDSQIHKELTGVGNELILKNIALMARLSGEIVIRIPVIGGVNDSDDNIRQTAEFVKNTVKNGKIELLPYHIYGEAKYEALGLPLPSAKFFTPSNERILELEEIIRGTGVSQISFK